MQQVAVRWQSKNLTWNCSIACQYTIGLLSLSSMSSLVSLWLIHYYERWYCQITKWGKSRFKKQGRRGKIIVRILCTVDYVLPEVMEEFCSSIWILNNVNQLLLIVFKYSRASIIIPENLFNNFVLMSGR